MKESTFQKYCLVVDEWFVNGFNGTKAYQKFYPKASYETADSAYRDIVEIPRIKDYIKSKQESTAERLKTSHEALLKELENWAYSDITETITLTPEQVKELPVEYRRLITKYKHTTKQIGSADGLMVENVIELWFVSKEKAMEMIHKHVGFYETDNSQQNKVYVLPSKKEVKKISDDLENDY